MSKLAATVAAQILADVMAEDWPVGEVFGSEAELLEQYGVSRAVFREAVRLVEHQQVATMRRGPGGGLVVIEPSAAASFSRNAVRSAGLLSAAPNSSIFSGPIPASQSRPSASRGATPEIDAAARHRRGSR